MPTRIRAWHRHYDPTLGRYTYNNANRLKTVSQSGNLLGTYTYNGREQLATRVITNSGSANGTTHFVHDQWGNILAELDATGSTVREYIWLPEAEIAPTRGSRTNVDRPIAVVSGVNTTPALLMVHVDQLNRPVKMTNSAGTVVWSALYSPFGGAYTLSGSETLNARFPGQWFQLEAGLHYNWHRHYDPSLGRYTQPDPLGFVDGPSVFSYALSSPYRYVDKDGRQSPSQSFPSSETRVCLKDTCQKCIRACNAGKTTMENFCRVTPMPPQAKALCWAATYLGTAGCLGYCYNNHCLDVPL